MSHDDPLPVAHLFIEHVVWNPGTEWSAALEHLATRFARSQPLDLSHVEAAGPLHLQISHLMEWATRASADLDRELGRFFDEHLAMHLRPAPATTRAVRTLATEHQLVALSALPPRAAESIARHLGVWRSIASLHGDVRTAEGISELRQLDAAHVLVAAEPTPIPPGVTSRGVSVPA